MITEPINIGHIPAIVWSAPSSKAYVFVHGKQSRKEEALGFAELAARKGWQTLSFDLPEHGSRQGGPLPCDVWNGVRELTAVGAYAARRWQRLGLFSCSLGAYFSLLAYRDYPFENCLLLSPILDMERLIRNMMTWSGVDEAALERRRQVPTPIGETLNWDYYQYVKAQPIDRWDMPTAILLGSEDHLTERETAARFAARFRAELTVLEGGEHHFHTPPQMDFLHGWLKRHIP